MAWGLVHAAQPPVARDLLRTALQVAARQLVAAFAPAHAARLGTACDGAFVQDTWGRRAPAGFLSYPGTDSTTV